MTVSMRVMSAGDGYKYLLRTVATGDVDRSLSTPLTRYYNAEGTPPGRWMGTGLPALGDGTLVEGSAVSEAQLQLLIGMGRDPLTGQALGRAYPIYKSQDERITDRVKALDPNLSLHEKAAAITQIETDEAGKSPRRAVAGFDFTFSVPKSASVLWAVADARTQQIIADAHHSAVTEMLAYMEREVAATRTGATAYDHFDSRAGDPHLHTHVVISNKVQTVLDGKWRSLDSRPMHAATVAISEMHEAVFADHLTRALGVGWETRDRGKDRNPAWAIASVPESLTAEFSSRSRMIDEEKDRLIADAAEHTSLRLTPFELASSPIGFRREDGTSVFRSRELRLLDPGSNLVSRLREMPALAKILAPTGKGSSLLGLRLAAQQVLVGYVVFILAVVMGFGMPFMYRAMGSTIGDFSASFPQTMLDMFGGGSLATTAGFMHLEVFGMVAPAAVIVVGAVAASSGIAGEERFRRMSLLLAQPISRARTYWTVAAAMALYVVFVSVALFLGTWAGTVVSGQSIQLNHLFHAVLLLALLGCFFGALTLLVAAATGRSSSAVWTTTAIAVATYFGYTLLLAAGHEGAAWWSPFRPYLYGPPLMEGMEWWQPVWLALGTVVLVVAGWPLFARRDIRISAG